MEKLQEIEELVSAGELEAAVGALTELIDANDATPGALTELVDANNTTAEGLDDLYFRRGKLYWRLGRRGEATSDYMKAVAVNPSSPASRALENARDVEAFYNKDLYNP